MFMATPKEQSTWRALAIASELGYTIAIPIVIFAIGGRMLDRRLGTTPLLLLTGILLAVVLSSLGIARKIKKIS